jgi:lysophospholipase L1-like esterase
MTDRAISEGPFRSLVVLGESTVAGGGWLSKTEHRWADVLWKLLEDAQEQTLAYHNAGIGASVISPKSPGYKASIKPSAAERLQEEVVSHNPDIVVIAYGLNDMRAGMDCSEFRSEMEKLLDRTRHAIDPMLVIANV